MRERERDHFRRCKKSDLYLVLLGTEEDAMSEV